MCTDLQLRVFFTPVRKFIAEDEDPRYVTQYERQQQKLHSERILIKQETPAPVDTAEPATVPA
jgi:hypothetical protein